METNYPDERLKLLFVCAHPAIDPGMHTPLMLQAVLGLDAVRIAGAFLVSPKTMGQRLVRAKTKIRDGGIRFEVPERQQLPQRLDAVLEAIYAAFGIGWDDMAGADQHGRGLTEEAIWLARVLLELMPGEAEVQGLLALMLHCEARRAARRDRDGRYVPLSEQDPKLWSLPLIEEAERHLAEASKYGRPGRFQLEAAIQSVHAERARGGRVEWSSDCSVLRPADPHIADNRPANWIRRGSCRSQWTGTGPRSSGCNRSRCSLCLSTLLGGSRSSPTTSWEETIEAQHAYDRAIGLAEDPAVRAVPASEAGLIVVPTSPKAGRSNKLVTCIFRMQL